VGSVIVVAIKTKISGTGRIIYGIEELTAKQLHNP
jgi:hypothetical protein